MGISVYVRALSGRYHAVRDCPDNAVFPYLGRRKFKIDLDQGCDMSCTANVLPTTYVVVKYSEIGI